MTNKWQRAITFICIASFLVTSCTTLERVSIPGSETTASIPAVQVGDSVVVTTKTGEDKKFTVTAIEPDALVGKDVRVPYAEMASLSVKESRTGKSSAWMVAFLVAVLIVVVAELADEDDSPNPAVPN